MALKRPLDRKPWPKWVWAFASLFFLTVVTFLIYLFISEGTGRAKWEQFRTEWEAKGEVFEWAAYIPPPIPDEENLAMAPVMQDLKATELAGIHKIPGFKVSQQLGWPDGKAKNLTTSFPTLSKEEADKRIANTFANRYEMLAELTSATRERTRCRFPLDYDISVSFDITSTVNELQALTSLCLYRSRWNHGQDRVYQSFTDWITAIHLVRASETIPSQLGFMVHRTLFHRSLQAIWELLHEHQLDDSQLKEAQTILMDQNFLIRFLHQSRINRALVLNWIDLRLLDDQRLIRSLGVTDPFFGHYPKGWWYEDKRTFCERLNRAYLYPNAVKAIDSVDIVHCQQVEMAIAQELKQDLTARVLPKNQSANIMATQITSFAGNALHAETELRLLRTAIALEQHYQKHQQFPPALGDLVPDYLPDVPLDPVDQKALRYKPQPVHKGYLLYGIGSNSTNDNGVKGQGFEGDWVWPMPSN